MDLEQLHREQHRANQIRHEALLAKYADELEKHVGEFVVFCLNTGEHYYYPTLPEAQKAQARLILDPNIFGVSWTYILPKTPATH